MADILTPEEKAALDSAEASAGKPVVNRYDFKHPARVNKTQLRTLENLHDNFARLLSSTFSGAMRAVVDVDTAFVDQTTYAEFIMSLSNPSSSYEFSLGPTKGRAIIDFAMPITFAFIDRIFGGKGSSKGVDARQMSQIEMGVLAKIVKRVVEDPEATWRPIVPAEIYDIELETNPEFLQICAANEIVILLAFEVNSTNASGLVSLCYPFSTLESLLPLLGQESWGRQEADDTDDRALGNRLRLAKTTVPIVAEVGRNQIPLTAIEDLGVGDVFTFTTRPTDPMVVYAGERPKYLGGPFAGTHDNMTVKIAGQIPSEDEEDFAPGSMGDPEEEVGICVTVRAELGRTNVTLDDHLSLEEGSTLELNKLVGEPVDVWLPDRRLGRGEIVTVNQYFGVRVTELADSSTQGPARDGRVLGYRHRLPQAPTVEPWGIPGDVDVSAMAASLTPSQRGWEPVGSSSPQEGSSEESPTEPQTAHKEPAPQHTPPSVPKEMLAKIQQVEVRSPYDETLKRVRLAVLDAREDAAALVSTLINQEEGAVHREPEVYTPPPSIDVKEATLGRRIISGFGKVFERGEPETEMDDSSPEDSEFSEADAFELPARQKLGVLFVAFGNEVGGEIMKFLSDYDIEETVHAIANLRSVSVEMQDQVLGEFEQHLLAGEWFSRGGMDFARGSLERAVGPKRAQQFLDRVSNRVSSGFYMLKNAAPEQVAPFISHEHPQTIALILSQLNPGQAAGILAQLPSRMQADVSYRIATMENITPAVLKEIGRSLEASLRDILGGDQDVGGPKVLGDMLNMSGSSVEKNVLDQIDAQDPEVAEAVRNLMFVFNDMVKLTDRELQIVLRKVDQKDLVIALKAARPEVAEKILGNMSERVRNFIIEEMNFLGPMRLSEVEEVQLRIVHTVRQLEGQGELTIVRGDADDLFV
ncbi:MAG: flagellar motor switch protein FliG [Gemmatimonadetes bacterium]|nr:flagellar motor switch protein FliG [Gemmatimonadota bacterium]